MARVRRTGIRFPRLVRYTDQAVVRKINQQIDKVTSEFGCGGPKGSYYNVRAKVEFAEKDIFSIYASAEYYCGGPYPTNDSNISITFDLVTGKQLQFRDLFADYEKNKRESFEQYFLNKSRGLKCSLGLAFERKAVAMVTPICSAWTILRALSSPSIFQETA